MMLLIRHLYENASANIVPSINYTNNGINIISDNSIRNSDITSNEYITPINNDIIPDSPDIITTNNNDIIPDIPNNNISPNNSNEL